MKVDSKSIEDRIVRAIYGMCDQKTPSVASDAIARETGLQEALVVRTLNRLVKGEDARVRFTPGGRWKLTRGENGRERGREEARRAALQENVDPSAGEPPDTVEPLVDTTPAPPPPPPPPEEPPTPEPPDQLKPLALTKDTSMLPCPFCGSSEISINGDMDPDPDGAREVQCGYCPGIVWGINEQEAIAAWNRRPAPPAIPAAAWSQTESTAANDLSELRSCIHQFGVWPDLRQKQERDYLGCVRHMSELIETLTRRGKVLEKELDEGLANEHRREGETLGEFIERIIEERDFPEHGDRRVGERTWEFIKRLVEERADALKISEERLMSTNGIIEQLTKERDDARASYQAVVDRVADEKLDGYRALGARAAAAEEERDEARREFERLIHERAVAHDDLRQVAAELVQMRGKVRELGELGAELGAVENEPVAVFMRRLKSERDGALEPVSRMAQELEEERQRRREAVAKSEEATKGLETVVERAEVLMLERDAAQLALDEVRCGWLSRVARAGIRVGRMLGDRIERL